MIIDHFIKHLVDGKQRVMAFKLDEYVHVGTPEEYQEFQFWDRYSEVLKKC